MFIHTSGEVPSSFWRLWWLAAAWRDFLEKIGESRDISWALTGSAAFQYYEGELKSNQRITDVDFAIPSSLKDKFLALLSDNPGRFAHINTHPTSVSFAFAGPSSGMIDVSYDPSNDWIFNERFLLRFESETDLRVEGNPLKGHFVNPATQLTMRMGHRYEPHPNPHKWLSNQYRIRHMLSLKIKPFGPIVALLQKYHAPSSAHLSLKAGTSKDEFFSKHLDTITYYFDHDQVHEFVSRYLFDDPVPQYRRMLADGEQVKCDRAKWEAFTYEEKLRDVIEEIAVISLERAHIPLMMSGMKVADTRQAANWAAMRVCTNLTKGWFRDWANENAVVAYENACRDDLSYEFWRAHERGEIKRIK